MNSTSRGSRLVSSAARSPGRSSTGPEVWRRLTPSSCATMCDSVVLPSPGGPNSSTWSRASPRRRAASMKTPSWWRIFSWPDVLVEPARAQRALERLLLRADRAAGDHARELVVLDRHGPILCLARRGRRGFVSGQHADARPGGLARPAVPPCAPRADARSATRPGGRRFAPRRRGETRDRAPGPRSAPRAGARGLPGGCTASSRSRRRRPRPRPRPPPGTWARSAHRRECAARVGDRLAREPEMRAHGAAAGLAVPHGAALSQTTKPGPRLCSIMSAKNGSAIAYSEPPKCVPK